MTYECETWWKTQGDEKELLMFERKYMFELVRPVRNELTEDYDRRKNTNREALYYKPNIECFLKANGRDIHGDLREA